MFFPLCSEAQQLTTVQQPASLVLAGESSTIKTALLLQYAYNAALRGEKLKSQFWHVCNYAPRLIDLTQVAVLWSFLGIAPRQRSLFLVSCLYFLLYLFHSS